MNDIKERLRNSRNWIQLIEDLEAEVEQIEDNGRCHFSLRCRRIRTVAQRREFR